MSDKTEQAEILDRIERGIDEQSLTFEQRARVEALKEARTILAARTFVGSGAVDVYGVIRVAEWILTGELPVQLPIVEISGGGTTLDVRQAVEDIAKRSGIGTI